MRLLRKFGIPVLVAAVVLNVLLASLMLQRVRELHRDWRTRVTRMDSRFGRLATRAHFESARQRLFGEIRAEIAKANPRIESDQASNYTELLMRASEKYPSVDPLMFLAIGIVESHYDVEATSVADARGLYQIWPSTGRRLAGMLGWEYADDMLYDPGHNTELAAVYLDLLLSTYNDPKMVFAEYNGGPLNAGYYRANSPRAASETVSYVSKVNALYGKLKNRVKEGSPSSIVRVDSVTREAQAIPTAFVSSHAGRRDDLEQ